MNKKIMISLVLIFAASTMHLDAMRGSPEARHKKIQQDFRNLQIKLGMQPADQRTMNWRFPVRGRQGTQQQLNKVRSELNNLLDQKSLDEQDIRKIQQKINELKRLNPARWPQPSDYEAMLQQTQ